MKNIMLDLETLSTQPNAYILSIGACRFDEYGVGDVFYANIIAAEQYVAHIDPTTVQWWLSQESNAQQALIKEQVQLAEALSQFMMFATSIPGSLVWGNGSDFDNVILANAYARNSFQCPWEFYNNKCYRTVKNIFPIGTKPKPEIKHHAMHDAVAQAHHLIEIRRNLFDSTGLDLFNSEVNKNAWHAYLDGNCS